jgi:polysaccharide pyruvyl transferase WcaK-like protein
MEAVGIERHPRLAFFGEVGSGNTGNDGSFEVALDWVRRGVPGAEIHAICLGPQQITSRFGIPAEPMQVPRVAGDSALALRAFRLVVRRGKDAVLVFRNLRDTDWVIVPGAGVLESSWHRPWMLPYALFTLTVSARLRNCRVALINVGADRAPSRISRWLVARVARRAHYLTVRDAHSLASLRSLGVPATDTQVHPDLAFALPRPPERTPEPRRVGLGLINYFDWRGTSEKRNAYEETMTSLAEWLLEQGYAVRLLTGDIWDSPCLRRVLEALRSRHPDLSPDRLVGEEARDLHQLMEQMSDVEVVIGSRYHNIISALRLAKPVVALSYAPKAIQAVERFGLGRFIHRIDAIDLTVLKDQFEELYTRRAEIELDMRGRLSEVEAELEAQREHFVSELF